jgi:hypothetical protein
MEKFEIMLCKRRLTALSGLTPITPLNNLKMRKFENLKMCFFVGLVFVLIVLLFSSCKTLKPYERVYVNDPEMELAKSPCKNFEGYVESIREGATPTAGSKSSGGCGCN